MLAPCQYALFCNIKHYEIEKVAESFEVSQF